MKKNTLLFAAVFLMLGPISACAGTVEPEHRACAKDDDCALISLACCPCLSSAPDSDAVNKQFVDQYKYQCTHDEVRRCAEMGACAHVATPVPVCREGQCTVEMRKVER